MSEYPSLPKQGENLAKFAWDVLKHTMQNEEAFFVSDEVLKKRITICQSCEHYDFEQHRCKECGCPLGMKAKISLESCPIGAWTASDEDWMNGGFEKLIEDMGKSQDS
tara:strand:+ start:1281 stop:1604 length:324 start_codon:yes stop_codon:yes gene_type:complete